MEDDGIRDGGRIIDWHACDLFPQSWIDLVVVLRVDSTNLYDRLKARCVSEDREKNVIQLVDATS